METFHWNVFIGYYPLGSRWLVVIVDPPRPYGRFIKLKHSKASMKFDHRTCWKIISDVQIGRFETFCRFDSKFDLQSIRCSACLSRFVLLTLYILELHRGITFWVYIGYYSLLDCELVMRPFKVVVHFGHSLGSYIAALWCGTMWPLRCSSTPTDILSQLKVERNLEEVEPLGKLQWSLAFGF